jgi:hypothetical protein
MNHVIKIRPEYVGGHIRAKVWIGQESSPGLCGELVLRMSDWTDLNWALLCGSRQTRATVIVECDRDTETKLRVEGWEAGAGVNSSRELLPSMPLTRAGLLAQLAELDRREAEERQPEPPVVEHRLAATDDRDGFRTCHCVCGFSVGDGPVATAEDDFAAHLADERAKAGVR